MPDSLHFTDSDEANELIASDPMALLVGFAFDQQVTVQKAFSGPLDLKRRLGSIDAETLASADLEPVFRQKPAIHRYPGNMAKRVHELAVHVRDEYGGEADRVWADAADSDELRTRIAALPGFGEMKIKALERSLRSASGSRSPRGWCRRIRPWATWTPPPRSTTTRPRSAPARRSGRRPAPDLRRSRRLLGVSGIPVRCRFARLARSRNAARMPKASGPPRRRGHGR